MELQEVLADLGAEFQEQILENRREEARELAGGEAATITLQARLLAAVGSEITLQLCDKNQILGTVAEVGPGWVLLSRAGRQVLVFTSAVVAVRNLPAQPAWASEIEKRMTPIIILRRWWQAGSWVHTSSAAGSFDGYIRRVGKDFIDLQTQESAPAGSQICLSLDNVWTVSVSR